MPIGASDRRASRGRAAPKARLAPEPLHVLRTTLILISTLTPGAILGASGVQDGRDGGDLQPRINAAIDHGVAALLAQQEIDGSWRAYQDGYVAGQTALCAYTLLKCGLPSGHQAIARAVDFLHTHPSRKTYGVSAEIIALCELDPGRHARWIEQLLDDLVSWQIAGGFAYPDRDVDLSNTQYATLALRAASRAGFDVAARVWERLADCALQHQESFSESDAPAGFCYHRDSYATGSMTTAGLTILSVCRENGVRTRQVERGLAAGLAWLEREFSVTENPLREPRYQYYYYYMYGLERVAALTYRERLGEHDWYREGAEVLIERQTDAGRWGGQDETCFALLFLSRATAPKSGEHATRGGGYYATEDAAADVSLVVTGDSPLTIWIDHFGRHVRDLEWEEDEGHGPRVLEVVYEADDGAGGWSPIARIEGDGTRPANGNRYAAQHTFAHPGKRSIQAVVHLLPPGAPGDDPAQAMELRSPPLEVLVSQAWNGELRSYAADASRNVLAGARLQVEASSQLSDAFKAERVADDRQSSGWLSADDDALPWIRLEPSKPVRASSLLLSHTFNPADPDRNHASRIQRVAVSINGSKSLLEVDMVPDDWRKTRVDLGRAQRIRTLELRVLEVRDGGTGMQGVGFAEVELQR